MRLKSKSFNIGIKGVILSDGKALIVENPKGEENRYSLPGGQIDKGETLEEALRREIEEELGVKKIKIKELLHVFERKHSFDKNLGLLIVVYRVEANAQKVRLSNEHVGYKWIDKKQLKVLNKGKNFHPGTVKSLSLVL